MNYINVINKVLTIYEVKLLFFFNEALKVGINKGQGQSDVIRNKDAFAESDVEWGQGVDESKEARQVYF